MENRVKVLNHKGKQIIYIDFTGIIGNEAIALLNKQEEESLKSVQKSILHLMNFTGSKMNTESKDHAIKMVNNLQSKGFTLKSACYGITGLQRIIANAINKELYFGKNELDARDWLTN